LEQQHGVFSGLKGRFSKPSPQGWVTAPIKNPPALKGPSTEYYLWFFDLGWENLDNQGYMG
jgi:hypothetical protein